MPAFIFPNGFQVIPGIVCTPAEVKAQACDITGNLHWVDNPLSPSGADALVWDTSGFITITNLIGNTTFRIPLYTVATLPAAGNKGRLAFTTDDNNFRVDNGTSWIILAPSILGDPVTPLHGGTGLDTSASTGVPVINAGVWSVSASLAVAKGGTGLTTLGGANTILGVNAAATALEYKSLSSTGATITITHAANNINLEAAAASGAKASFRDLTVFTDQDNSPKKMRAICQEAILVDSSGNPKLFTNINQAADLDVAGAGGLDTGTAAINTDYDFYLIGKADGTIAAIWSKSMQYQEDEYPDTNRDATLGLRDAAARTKIAQGFKVTTSAKIHSIDVSLQRTGTLAASDGIWATIESDSAGVPSGTILARSVMLLPINGLDTAAARIRMRFVFPERISLTAGTQYHFVLQGNYTISAVNFINVGVDASAPTNANGSVSTFDGATWTADTTRDFALFIVNSLTGTESVTMPTGYIYKGRCSYNRASGGGGIFQITQRGNFWRRNEQQLTANPVTANTRTTFDKVGQLPIYWADQYVYLIETNGAIAMLLANPLPMGGPNIAATQQLFHKIAAGNGAGRFFHELTTPGWTGPMIWLANSGVAAGDHSAVGAYLSL